MWHFTKGSVVLSILIASAGLGQAQVYGRGYYDNGRFYGEFGRYPDNRKGSPGTLLDRVRGDLDRVEADSYTDNHDRRRFNKVREELGEFQSKWVNGHFDRHELDDAIGALQHVVNDNRLNYRGRDLLQDDLARLRELRASGGYYR